MLTENDKKWIGSCYFPRGQKSFNETKKKFINDIQGVKLNKADGIVFVTNQELKLAEREDLENKKNKCEIEIYHLERITTILNSPACYGIRLEFLDIEMTKEEQLSFIVSYGNKMNALLDHIKSLSESNRESNTNNSVCVVSEEYNIYPWDQDRHHKCSYCNFGFKISSNSYWGLTATSGLSSATVTCPKCGCVDKLF